MRLLRSLPENARGDAMPVRLITPHQTPELEDSDNTSGSGHSEI
jgi:hypothetical protein